MTMNKTDLPRFAISDVPAAIGLLTRIPIPVDAQSATVRGARAAWAYPIAGLAVGSAGALAGATALTFASSAELAAALALLVMVVITGALHEDGLADCADGFWGGHTPARRLEIMKDSRIGAYGVIALILSLLIRWIALTALFDAGFVWSGPIAAAALSRAFMVVVMCIMPQARTDGLGATVGSPDIWTTCLALGIGIVVVTVLWPKFLWAGGICLVLGVFGPLLIAQRKIGGQTGDVLGATQQVSDILLLIAFAAGVSGQG